MWKRLFAAAGLAAVLAGCDQMNTDQTGAPLPETSAPTTSDPTTSTTPSTSTPATEPTPPNNTAVNERDASGATKTPIDQDETQADVNRTAEIRKRILDTEDLSVNARNAKVITSQGKVTLRGPVESEAERDTLAKIATDVAGAGNVDNQLEVKPPQP
jgi:hyperosmotically inducible protein